MNINQKLDKAEDILRRCIGGKGVWADPTRYKYQCWTRDLVIAIMPALIEIGEAKVVKMHLINLSEKQRSNGQIPILFLDDTLKWFYLKAKKGIKEHQFPFMIKRFLLGQLWNLTPGTKDSEILYIIGMHEYANKTGDKSLLKKYKGNISKALKYIENNNLRDGFVVGSDWRDTMEKPLAEKPLLTNNCLMFYAYSLMGEIKKAEEFKKKINDFFWRNNSYIDYPGNERFDPLGGAFAVLFGVAGRDKFKELVKSYHKVDTNIGVTIKCKHNPFTEAEKEVIERTDGVVVWPFIVGYSVLALEKMGDKKYSKELFEKLVGLDGFYEWYDPETGKGYGALEQLWSATLLIRSSKIFK